MAKVNLMGRAHMARLGNGKQPPSGRAYIAKLNSNCKGANNRGQYFILAAVMVGLLIYTTKPPSNSINILEDDAVGEFAGNAVSEYVRVVDYSLSGPEMLRNNLYSFSDFLANRSKEHMWTYKAFYLVEYSTPYNITLVYGNFLGEASGFNISGIYYPVGDRVSSEMALPRAPVTVSYAGSGIRFYLNRSVSAYFHVEVCALDYCQTREKNV